MPPSTDMWEHILLQLYRQALVCTLGQSKNLLACIVASLFQSSYSPYFRKYQIMYQSRILLLLFLWCTRIFCARKVIEYHVSTTCSKWEKPKMDLLEFVLVVHIICEVWCMKNLSLGIITESTSVFLLVNSQCSFAIQLSYCYSNQSPWSYSIIWHHVITTMNSVGLQMWKYVVWFSAFRFIWLSQ